MRFAINFHAMSSLQRSAVGELAFGERFVFQEREPPGSTTRYRLSGSLNALWRPFSHAHVDATLSDTLIAKGVPLFHPVRTLSEQLAKSGAIESLDLVVHLDDRVNLWLDLVEYWKANPEVFSRDASFMRDNMGPKRGANLTTIAEQDMRSINQPGVLAEAESEAVCQPSNF